MKQRPTARDLSKNCARRFVCNCEGWQAQSHIRRELLDNGYDELPIVSSHAFGIEVLPRIHNDPFDRILIAQATVEGITLLTADAVIAQYPGPIRKV